MPLKKIINITIKTQKISEDLSDIYENKIRSISEEYNKLQNENQQQKRRIKSLENINIQNDLIIQELRAQFLQEIKSVARNKNKKWE